MAGFTLWWVNLHCIALAGFTLYWADLLSSVWSSMQSAYLPSIEWVDLAVAAIAAIMRDFLHTKHFKIILS